MTKIPLYYGFIGGFLVTTYYAVLYTINKDLLFNIGLVWAALSIYLFFMVVGVWQQKRLSGGHYPFKEALSTAFIIFLIINFLYYTFQYFLFNVISPDLVQMQYDLIMENKEQIINMMGTEEGNKYLQELSLDNLKLTPGKAFFGFCQAALGGFFMAVVIAFLFREEKNATPING